MLASVRFASTVLRLAQIGRRTAEYLQGLQQSRWRSLLHFANQRSPFYRERFEGLDLRRCRVGDVPPLTRAEMMDHFDDLVTDPRVRLDPVRQFLDDPANHGRLFGDRHVVCCTSGNHGQPALVVQERSAALLVMAVQVARGWCGDNPARELFDRWWRPARLAVVTQRPGSCASSAFFSCLERSRIRFWEFLHLSVFDPLPEVVAKLNAFQPQCLIAYPYAFECLANAQKAGRLRLGPAGLRTLANIGDPLPESIRTTVEGAFGIQVSDFQCPAECMALTTACLHGGTHVNTDLALLEVVDERNRAVPDGVPGSKSLVTNFYNLVQPIIRYEIADAVKVSREPCPCGSRFPLLQLAGGRSRERFWIDVDGRHREIPYFVFLAALERCMEMAEHQVLQTGWNRFVVRAVPRPGKSLWPEQVWRLVQQSLEAEGLAQQLDWEVQIVDEIPPDRRSGKVQRARNLVGPPPLLVSVEEAATWEPAAAV
jgi:phenylacetate-coenzyme A ligase PaaK-like adenylate-forming protein